MNTLFTAPDCYLNASDRNSIPILILNTDAAKTWLDGQDSPVRRQAEQQGFQGKPNELCFIHDPEGLVHQILVGYTKEISNYTLSPVVDALKGMSEDFINTVSFSIQGDHDTESLNKLCIGWGWANYKFDTYKKNKNPVPMLVWPDDVDQDRVTAFVEGVSLIRNLVNTPANHLGTEELSASAETLAKKHKAKFSKIVGEKLLEQNFPMIYAVGKASPRPPHLIEFQWGDKKHPKLTLVGKGIVFDTGGLNIKPGPYMRDMKKDMGGAAHVLGLASIIMSLKLPVNLRVLIASAENAIAGNAFRPGDILNTRKGISVEIGDTDAEGRLVVGDALTYACEEETDLLVDFCTLTGAARVALGYDIPAFFANQDIIQQDLREAGFENDDPVWPLPLYDGYEKNIASNVADIINDGKGRAGAIEAALFLQRFIDTSRDWVHFDCYAWEQTGKAGRPQGGADTGMRAMFHYLESRYGKAA